MNAQSGRSRAVNAVERTSRLTCRGTWTVSRAVKLYIEGLWKDAEDTETVRQAPKRGNYTTKLARVPHNETVYRKVREFVRERWASHARILATQVLEFIIKDGIVRVE